MNRNEAYPIDDLINLEDAWEVAPGEENTFPVPCNFGEMGNLFSLIPYTTSLMLDNAPHYASSTPAGSSSATRGVSETFCFRDIGRGFSTSKAGVLPPASKSLNLTRASTTRPPAPSFNKKTLQVSPRGTPSVQDSGALRSFLSDVVKERDHFEEISLLGAQPNVSSVFSLSKFGILPRDIDKLEGYSSEQAIQARSLDVSLVRTIAFITVLKAWLVLLVAS